MYACVLFYLMVTNDLPGGTHRIMTLKEKNLDTANPETTIGPLCESDPYDSPF